MKFSIFVSFQKALLVLCLISCFALTVSAANYYPSEIGNTWVFLSADGGEKLTYTIEPPKDSDVEGLIVLKITNEAIGTDLATSTDLYDITIENDGSLLLHHSLTDEGAFGIADVTYDPPVTFFPAELPLGHTWQIMAETELQLVGAVSSTTTITVVAIEDVETAAGVFKDCVKLEIKQKDITAIAVLRKTSYQWLASDIGPVKFLNDQEVVYELQDYTLLEPKSETPLMEVSLEQRPTKNVEYIKIGIELNNGKDVAGYSSLVAFDRTVLKYISATEGDYLPSDGIFIRPLLDEDDTYKLSLDIGSITQTDTTVTFGVQRLSISDFFFSFPDVPPEFERPNAEYWGVAILGSAPIDSDTQLPAATDGNGTLVTLTFEVIDKDKPAIIALPELSLTDAFDIPLPVTTKEMVITHLAPLVDDKLSTDVNGDGKVDILDLVRVASSFGEPVSTENAAVDVNGDGEINILDLVQIAQDFGK